jgi:hypothetical protein
VTDAAPSKPRTDHRPAPPDASVARFLREAAIVLAGALALYLATVAPGPLWQDSGLAQVRVLRCDIRGDLGLALAHPLYYLIAIAFQLLPLAESALKTNLVSAIFGAITVAEVYLLLRLLKCRRTAAIVGTLTLAVAHTFWQHCALAEVYTITTALLVAELLCFTAYRRTGDGRWLVLLLLASGLGISNHMIAVLNLPVWGVVFLMLIWRRSISPKLVLLGIAAWLAGASIYLGLIAGEMAGGRPIVAVVRSALFGDYYASNVTNLRLSARMIVNTILYMGLSFPTPTALLGCVGIVALCRRPTRPLRWVLLAIFAIHLAWAIRYDVPDQYTFFIPAIVIYAILIGVGADRALTRWPSRSVRIAAIVLALMPIAVYAALPTIAKRVHLSLGTRDVPFRDTYQYFLWPWKTGEDGPRRFAYAVQAGVPAGSTVILDTTTARPAQYLMLTGRWTNDIVVWPGLPDTPQAFPARPAITDLADALAAGHLYVLDPGGSLVPRELSSAEFAPDGVLFRVEPPSNLDPP